jgi:hypothetical protein
VQVTDAESLRGQRRNVSAGTVCPLFPHNGIVPPF